MNLENQDFVDELDGDSGDDIITLVGEDGSEIDFFVAAVIPYNGKMYGILQPVELLEGMQEDEALVFECDEENFDLVTDDGIIDAVFAKYDELIANEEN